MPAGLTGDQGVILPATNVSTLMLRDDVVEAVAQGKFHLWPVRTIDEGIELLTGVQAGERGPDGAYPSDTVNGRVDRRLRELAERMQAFGQKPWDASNQNGSRASGEDQPGEEDSAGPAEPQPGEPDLKETVAGR